MSEFVLNRMAEIKAKVHRVESCFKEKHLKSVCNDVLDFMGTKVTPTQVYNHMRRWKQKWIMVCTVREMEGVTWCKETTALMMDDEKLIAHLMVR